MNQEEILKEFTDAEALLKGHFILSSGLHSETYMQCARALMDPARAARLCAALVTKLKESLPNQKFDMVASPAMGGVIVGYEVARQLGLPSIFCERVDGKFTLRRGFTVPKAARVLLVEDVVTTAKSSMEAIDCIRENGGEVIAEACLVDRSEISTPLLIPLVSLLRMPIATFEPTEIPDHLKNTPAVKPGSRFIKSA